MVILQKNIDFFALFKGKDLRENILAFCPVLRVK
jgi:hypothetical protein